MTMKQDANTSDIFIKDIRDIKDISAVDMPSYETELEIVRLHIREGDITIDHQRALIANLQKRDLSASVAEAMLDIFESAKSHRLQQLKRLLSLH